MDIRATLIDIYDNKANGRYGLSGVNQLQHALQSAALAQANGEPATFVVAALLHDVGHMIHEFGQDAADEGIDDRHEERAACWLAGSETPCEHPLVCWKRGRALPLPVLHGERVG
jgi:[1-hydroxy-2-(trimethylamino)ethyl]phosphonate dioxygenase